MVPDAYEPHELGVTCEARSGVPLGVGAADGLGAGAVVVGVGLGAGVTLDARGGRLLSRLSTGKGVDIIDYSPSLGHLYVPGSKSGTLGILDVSSTGALTLLSEVPIPTGSHCVAADASGHAYVCDPKGGRILVVADGP